MIKAQGALRLSIAVVFILAAVLLATLKAPAGETASEIISALKGTEVQAPGFSDSQGFAESAEPSNIQLLGQYPMGEASALAIDPERRIAFVAVGAGIHAYDLETVLDPPEISTVGAPDVVTGVVYSSNMLYMAVYSKGLMIVDVTDAAAPVQKGFFEISGKCVAVQVAGKFAYVADESNGLKIIDVSDPASPTESGMVKLAGIKSITVSGDLVYASNGDDVFILDVSNPSSAGFKGMMQTPGQALSVAVSGSYAYVADGYKGLRIMDVSDPSSPKEVGFIQPTDCVGVAVNGSLLYYLSKWSYVRIIDVSDLKTPKELGDYYSGENRYYRDIVFAGNVLYTLSFHSPDDYNERMDFVMDIFETNQSDELSLVGSKSLPGPTLAGVVEGSHAYVTTMDSRFYILDVEDPGVTAKKGSFTFDSFQTEAGRPFISGSHAYVPRIGKLSIFDISDPNTPKEVSSLPTNDPTYSVFVSDGHAYVGGGQYLWFYDVSDPSQPKVEGIPYKHGFYGPTKIIVSGKHAYLLFESNVLIVDISNTSGPTKVAEYYTWKGDMSIQDDRFYFIERYGVLHILDISNPAKPVELKVSADYGEGLNLDCSGMEVAGKLAYLASSNGLVILDVSNPSSVKFVDKLPLAPGIRTVSISDSLIYATGSSSGLWIMEYSVPPLEAGFEANPTSGLAPLAVKFADSSKGQVTGWSWVFGDGGTSSERSPKHIYKASGSYTVSLTVTGSGGTDTMTREDCIQVTEPAPIARFVGTPRKGKAPLTVQFQDNSVNSVESRLWDFGDGSTGTERSPTHTYTQAGVYTVSLTLTGPGGSGTKTLKDYITVTEPRVRANFSAKPTSGKVPLEVKFTDKSEGNITRWSWSFGDGGVSNEQNPAHTYTKAEAFTVKLTVSGPGGSSTRTRARFIKVADDETTFISGRVTSASGSGIQNVDVRVIRLQDFQPGTVASALTDSKGNYLIKSVPPGTYKVQFWAGNTGYASEWYDDKGGNCVDATDVTVKPGSKLTGMDATLELAGSISGRVTDTNGKGIERMRVIVLTGERDSNGNTFPVSEVATAADGTYRVSGIPSGSYKVYFPGHEAGYSPEWYNDRSNMDEADSVVVTAPKVTAGIDAVLFRAGGISGRIIDASGGGVGNVEVQVFGAQHTWMGNTRSEADGAYSVNGLASGTYKVFFKAEDIGYGAEWYDNKSTFETAADVVVKAPKTTANINAVLEEAGPTSSISGRVYDVSGAPIKNVWVSVAPVNDRYNYPYGSHSDAAGEYTIQNVPAGDYILLFWGGEVGYVSEWYDNSSTFDGGEVISVTPPGNVTGINGVLERAANGAGRATDIVEDSPEGTRVSTTIHEETDAP